MEKIIQTKRIIIKVSQLVPCKNNKKKRRFSPMIVTVFGIFNIFLLILLI